MPVSDTLARCVRRVYSSSMSVLNLLCLDLCLVFVVLLVVLVYFRVEGADGQSAL